MLKLACDYCKKEIDAGASRCPYCGGEYSPTQVAERKKTMRHAAGFGCVALLVLAGLIGWCSSPSKDAEPADNPTPIEATTMPPVEQAKLQKAAKDAEEFWKLEKLPKGAPEAPVTSDCQDELCVGSKAQFERHDWPKAWQGDYAGQRNVAHCRSTGCNGAVEINQAEACAWRALIIEKHAAKTTDGDSANFKADCGKLDAAGAASASAKAEELLKQIYHGA